MPPPLVGAAAAAAITTFFATPIIAGVTIGSLTLSVALAGASYLVNAALAPPVPAGITNPDAGQKLTVQQPVPSQRLIYGRALVGGPIFFYECKPPYLYVGIVLCSHEIEGMVELRIGDKIVQLDVDGNAISSNFNNGSTSYLQVSIRTGTATQAIDPILAADFPELDTVNWRQYGHATAVLKMYYGNDSDNHNFFWGSGSPKPYFLIDGMKCYDPRKAGHSLLDSSTWEWTDNASLCIANYITHAKGLNRPWSTIDIPALIIAANHDDEQMYRKEDGNYEARYSINGVVDTQTEPSQVLLDMLTANLGRLIWRDGQYTILSGVGRDAVWTLNDDSARGPMDARYNRPMRELINTVRTVFTAPDREYQTANGPVIQNAAYLAADGEEHGITITLPYTSTHTRAQRIAKATLERARIGKLITRRQSIDAMRLSASDIVNVESAFLTSLNMTGEINAMKLSADSLEIEIEIEQYSKSIYDWNALVDEQVFFINPVDLAGVN